MNFILNIHVHVKFRAFGFTFGTEDVTAALSYSGGKIAFNLGGNVPSTGTTVIYNNRGVLVEAWV